MSKRLGAWWNSSADAEKLATHIKGFFSVGVVTAIVYILKLFGVDLSIDSFNGLLDSAMGILVAIAYAISLIISFYGLIRRIFFKAARLGVYKK